MHSWQGNLLLSLYKLKHFLMDRSDELDISKERREIEMAPWLFKPLEPIECTPVLAGSVPAEWIHARGVSPGRVMLYLHGGSFVSGSIHSHRPLAANIAIACNARALVIDYRLAPEHPYPAPLLDSLAAYEWLLASGYAPQQIAIAGDSAGGTLTLTLLLKLKELERPLPGLAVCISPATDFTLSGESWVRNSGKDIMLDMKPLISAGILYLRDADLHSPLVSPLFGDLRDLPPMLIQVGSVELLYSDATRFAEKAKEAGVPATLEVLDGMQHVWQYTASFVPEARQAIVQIGRFANSIWGE